MEVDDQSERGSENGIVSVNASESQCSLLRHIIYLVSVLYLHGRHRAPLLSPDSLLPVNIERFPRFLPRL